MPEYFFRAYTWPCFFEDEQEHMRDFALIAKGVGYDNVAIIRALRQEWGLSLNDAYGLLKGRLAA